MAFSSISDLWNEWNMRGFIILSLSLQVFLILFAPLRKKTANNLVVSLLWLAYLMADWVAAFGIGLISHNQGNSCAHAVEVDRAFQAFWASFLLLHLGGPDTITAFSLEDSSLWRRHLLSLIFQVAAALYVFAQIFPNDRSLVIPTILVFLAAVIKNAERTLALNLSSLQRFKQSMLAMIQSSYADIYWGEAGKKLVDELDALGYGYSDEEEAKLPETIAVKHAHTFFRIFKVIIGDLLFTEEQRRTSRKYFFKVSAVDALRVISLELNFLYEVLHTKALVIRSKWSYIFRFIAFTNVVIAFVLFNRLKKHQLPKLNVEITYTLLFGGIALDAIALFMLIFSDWTVVCIDRDSFLHKLISAAYSLRKPRFTNCEAEPNTDATYAVLDTPLIFRRWSESISACNLFSMCFKESPRKMHKHDRCRGIIAFSIVCRFSFCMAEKIMSCFHQAGEKIAKRCGLKMGTSMTASTTYVSKNPFVNKLWVFIFEEVRRKSKDAERGAKAREIFEARGALSIGSSVGEVGRGSLSTYFTDLTFDDSIMALHIATEVMYNMDKPFNARNDEREFSKILSDYMLYLVLNQPSVVSAVVGMAQISSVTTLLELKHRIDHAITDVEGLCKALLKAGDVDGHPTLLQRGKDAAKRMGSLGERKWKVMSGVWVEMLCYAAVHIKGEAHVQVLSKGGELLAFVWLLMVHFGCFYTPQLGAYVGDIQ